METQTGQTASEVLAKFDADIADAEARVRVLRQKRDALATVLEDEDLLTVLARFTGFDGREPMFEAREKHEVGRRGPSHREMVLDTIAKKKLTMFRTKQVTGALNDQGRDLTNVQVSNALSALARDEVIESTPALGKGTWRLIRFDLVHHEGNPAEAGSPPVPPSSLHPETGAV